MGQLGNHKTVQLDLPSGDWVKVRNRLTLGDLSDIGTIQAPDERALLSLTRLFVEWSFTETDEPDSPRAEISVANVRLMDLDDFNFIDQWLENEVASAVKGVDTAEKKDSTATSTEMAGQTQPLPVVTPGIS